MARSPGPNREVFRLTPPLIFWWVWVAFAVANVADFAIQGAPARFAIVVSAILVAITGLAYALALRPRVIAEPSGLTIVNPFRDHHVPWAAITAVDTGDWVRVHYAPGQAAPGAAAAQGSTAAARPARPSRAGRSTSPPGPSAGPPGPGPGPCPRAGRSGLLRGGRADSSAFGRSPGPEPGTRRRPGCPRRRSTSPRCRPPRPSPSAWTPARTASAPAARARPGEAHGASRHGPVVLAADRRGGPARARPADRRPGLARSYQRYGSGSDGSGMAS